MRIDKYLADMSCGSRKEVKELLKLGRVKVNDVIIKKNDYKVNENDIVKLDDEIINYLEYEYYILNKPAGYISALEDNRYPVIIDLVNTRRKDVVPVGRLDLDTEGIILLTNDGQLNNRLLSAKYHVDKKYYVELESDIDESAIDTFARPLDLGDFITLPAKLEILDKRSAYLTISEGKYHQVKRMFEAIGNKVIYLRRDEFGPLKTGDLKLGEFRELTEEERKELLKY